jgi:hypothetical protein
MAGCFAKAPMIGSSRCLRARSAFNLTISSFAAYRKTTLARGAQIRHVVSAAFSDMTRQPRPSEGARSFADAGASCPSLMSRLQRDTRRGLGRC